MSRATPAIGAFAPLARLGRDPRQLLRDDGGAILVLGVISSVLLVSVLYYVYGIGESVLFRERMQDAADAAALSTAIGHARGMNLIVFLNLVMAALVAVLLALKVIETLLSALLVILTALSFFVPGAGSAIPPVNEARASTHASHESVRGVVDPLLVVLNTTQRVVAAIVPTASVIKTAVDVEREYDDVVDGAPPVTLPTRAALPVENDRFERTCRKASELLVDLVTSATGAVPFIGEVLGGLLSATIEAVSAWYCRGESGASTELRFERVLPQSDAGQRCETALVERRSDAGACDLWQAELAARRPAHGTGDCALPSAACEANLREARVACDPRDPRLRHFSFARARVIESLEYTAAGWRTIGYRYTDVELVNPPPPARAGAGNTPRRPSDERPCFPQVASGIERWSAVETRVQRADASGAGDVIPVCTRGRREPPAAVGRAAPLVGTRVELEYEGVKHIYGCTLPVRRELALASGAPPQRSQDDRPRAPQKIEDGLELGAEAFQIRAAIVSGRDPTPRADAGISVATWRRARSPEGWVAPARALGRVALAQAEYYYDHDGSEPRAEWSWNMKWRARLVRFRLPASESELPRSSNEHQQLASTPPFSLELERIPAPDGVDLPELGSIIVH